MHGAIPLYIGCVQNKNNEKRRPEKPNLPPLPHRGIVIYYLPFSDRSAAW